MSGLEVLSVISSIISIVDAIVNISESCKDVDGMPSSMRDAHARLPLVTATLDLIKNDGGSNWDPNSRRAMEKVLKACEKKATRLSKMFRASIPPELPKQSFRKRFTNAALMTIRVHRSRKIDSLMKGILEDIQLLADNRALSDATRYRIRESTEAIRRGLPFSYVSSAVVVPSAYGHTPHSAPQSQHSGSQNYHHGAGIHNFHVHGGGVLNINSGQSPFIVGTITGGGFPFPTAANL